MNFNFFRIFHAKLRRTLEKINFLTPMNKVWNFIQKNVVIEILTYTFYHQKRKFLKNQPKSFQNIQFLKITIYNFNTLTKPQVPDRASLTLGAARLKYRKPGRRSLWVSFVKNAILHVRKRFRLGHGIQHTLVY